MMNKLALNTHFRRIILINDEKNLKSSPLITNPTYPPPPPHPPPPLFRFFKKRVLNSFICRHLLILTARPHNFFTIRSFKAYLLKSSQLKYLSIRYLRKYIKLPVLPFTFLNFKDFFLE